MEPDADVNSQALSSGEFEPEPLGQTPLEGLRIPRATHLLRLEKEGFAPAERLASSALARAQTEIIGSGQDIVVHVELVP
ncbi:MAG: PEGA domain-containing protein, partial [Gammaproteobacteria bacterium]|nr:PEGA domain-containing protein [Gammaproteobacteria bacterium]NIW38347.1 PEGA domain-containing protein [Gemmatimonadota bacterium]